MSFERERIETPDGDFLDLDWVHNTLNLNGSGRVVVLLHGLEGCSERAYMRGMTKVLSAAGWTVCALNFRSCSGELNRLPRSYHSGVTEDLKTVLSAISDRYEHVCAAGFSLGGNVLLKYLGEEGGGSKIEAAVAISTPCDLKGSAEKLELESNRKYMRRFLRSLSAKMEAKSRLFPEQICVDDFESIRSFRAFDDRYTAPLHGFDDAEDYWRRCSSKSFLKHITIPTAILTAKDDPFLSESCYPEEEARLNSNVFLDTPRFGGHLGFYNRNTFWSERQVVKFLGEAIS